MKFKELMMRMNLQLFAEAVKGKKIAYLYRLLDDQATEAAQYVAFTTENGTTYSRDADTIVTKDGTIRDPGEVEVEITTTALLSVGDVMLKKLRDALINGKKIEVWEVNLAEPGTGDNKFKARYYQGYVTEFEETSAAEDYVECSLTIAAEGSGADGEATVTEIQQEMIELYGFKDTTKTGA